MVGLSVVLESQKTTPIYSESSRPQVINKATMIKPSSPTPTSRKNTPATLPATGFLDRCFLCDRKLLPGKDIYMYKGDRGFCSEECRCRQIFMDEEEALRAKTSSDTYYSWSAAPAAAVKKPQSAATSSSSSASRSRRGIRNRAGC